MPRWKSRLDLTISGDHVIALQEVAHEHNVPLLDLMGRLVVLLLEYEKLSREGYHLGVSKDPSTLDIRLTGLWD